MKPTSMRELKFRAWDKKHNSWFENGVGFHMEWWLNYRPLFKEKLLFQQYTGLKDKNGKEIYEGDIMLTDDVYHDYEGGVAINELPDGKFLEVRWEDGAFFVGDELLSEMAKYYEVIGNIYSNPELIKNYEAN